MDQLTRPIWQGCIELGCGAEHYGHFETAESMFEAALKDISSMSVDDPSMARKMRAVADAFQKAGNTERALRHYKHALSVFTNSLGKNDFETAEVKTRIAETFFSRDQTKMAVIWYRHAISTAIRSKNAKPEKIECWQERANTLVELSRLR